MVDLRYCQVNQDRGIPSYAQSLVLSLCDLHPEHRYIWLRKEHAPFPSRKTDLSARGEWCTEREAKSDRKLSLDAFLSTCLFMDQEDRGSEFLLPHWLNRHSPIKLGIVYDLIPWIFPEPYLRTPASREAYSSSLRLMKSYDRLYAISESTRQDAIRIGGLDPYQVLTLPGGLDPRKEAMLSTSSVPGVAAQYGVGPDFFLYVGGEDWRKNMEGMVRAFARFHPSRPKSQLVLVCKMPDFRRARYRALAVELGLPPEAVVCTGLVSDQELMTLNRGACAMVFPSFYEGLGLPVLEAYACGTPVLGSDNSSVRDLVHPACRFDPSSIEDIARVLDRFTRDPELSANSIAFGQQALANLSWKGSAEIVAKAMATDSPAPSILLSAASPRIAVAGVLPPSDTGIASYTWRYLQGRTWTTDFFSTTTHLPQRAPAEGLAPGNRQFPAETLGAALHRIHYQGTLFVLGNSTHHTGVIASMLRTRLEPGQPRWAYLHEADLWSPVAAILESGRQFLRDEPASPIPPNTPNWIRQAIQEMPGLAPSLRFLRRRGNLHGFIVNSCACRDLIHAALGPEAEGWPIEVAFLPVAPTHLLPCHPPDNVLRVGFFGMPARNKRPDLVVKAFEQLAKQRSAHLTLAGWGMGAFCKSLGLLGRKDVLCLDAPSDEQLEEAMAGVDIAVQLRVPTIGETSGVICQMLALGTRIIVTDVGSYAEIDDGLVFKIPVDADAEYLAKVLNQFEPINGPSRHSYLASHSPAAFEQRIAQILNL
jgi:glycosyltransferase involved in cell wall biosynthesis